MAKYDVYTADAFAEKMDAFIGFCDSAGIDATDYQLIRFFRITSAVLERYRSYKKGDSEDADDETTAAALKKLDLYREDATIRQAVAEPKLASHCALKLRQPHWGGWSDKAEPAQAVDIHIKIGDGSSELLD